MRLQRIGKKGQAYFRIVATEHTKKPQGKFLELLGSYDPHLKVLKVKKERIEHWQKEGVQMSPTLNNILINNGVIQGDKKLSWKPKKRSKPVSVEATPVEAKETKEETSPVEVETPVA